MKHIVPELVPDAGTTSTTMPKRTLVSFTHRDPFALAAALARTMLTERTWRVTIETWEVETDGKEEEG